MLYDNLQGASDYIFIHLYVADKLSYLLLPQFSLYLKFMEVRTKSDYLHGMYCRLKGLTTISRRKYGLYNKAIDGRNLFKVFPWLNDMR